MFSSDTLKLIAKFNCELTKYKNNVNSSYRKLKCFKNHHLPFIYQDQNIYKYAFYFFLLFSSFLLYKNHNDYKSIFLNFSLEFIGDISNGF